VTAWLPINCTGISLPTAIPRNSAAICYLPLGLQTTLPTLQFRLSPTGGFLHLPIEDLILPLSGDGTPAQNPWGKRICIQRGLSINNEQSVITFGNRALTSLFTVLAMNTQQVGMANKRYFNASSIQCVVRKECIGMQTHIVDVNKCQDPLCDEYYFFVSNDITKTCELSTSFHVTAVLFLLLFIGLEMGLNEVQAWLTRQVYKNVTAV